MVTTFGRPGYLPWNRRHVVPMTGVMGSGQARSAAGQTRREVGLHLVQRHPVLRHRVPLADRDRLVVEGLEVDSEAVRRADLVLAAVAAADGSGVVEVDVPDPATAVEPGALQSESDIAWRLEYVQSR